MVFLNGKPVTRCWNHHWSFFAMVDNSNKEKVRDGTEGIVETVIAWSRWYVGIRHSNKIACMPTLREQAVYRHWVEHGSNGLSAAIGMGYYPTHWVQRRIESIAG